MYGLVQMVIRNGFVRLQDLTDDRQHEVNVETIGGITG